MRKIDNKADIVNGQPKKKVKRDSDIASDYFMLGRESAQIEQKKKEIDQNLMLTLGQQIILHQAQMEMQRVLNEVKLRQSELDMKMAQAMQPPPLPMGLPMPPGDMSMPPGGGEGGAGMPPDMPIGGMPVGAAGLPPLEGIGGGSPQTNGLDLTGGFPMPPGGGGEMPPQQPQAPGLS